jgi:hypothetical protein
VSARELATELWDDMDPGIRPAVRLLREHGFETISSCQGGPGHPEPEPVILLLGGAGAGAAAHKLLAGHGHPVKSVQILRWYCPGCDRLSGTHWRVTLGEPKGRHVGDHVPICGPPFGELQ